MDPGTVNDEVMEECRALQEDELLAMESIFGDGEFEQLEATEDMLHFRLHVPVELPPGGVMLRALVPLKNTAGSEEEEGDFNMAGEISLSHLPPLQLTCTYPSCYPALSAPLCALQCGWLDEYQLGLVVEKLDGLWQPGEEVVFTWTEWLKENTLPLLLADQDYHETPGKGPAVLEVQVEGQGGCNEEVKDEKGEESGGGGERRAVSTLKNANQDLLALVRYDRAEAWKAFVLEDHECLLCFDEKSGEDFISLDCCGQAYCRECLAEMVEMNVKEKNVRGLRCPACNADFHLSVVQELLPDGSSTEEWEKVVLEKSLQCMGDIRYCIRCTNAVVVEDNLGRCPHCFFTFCARCLQAYHPGSSCDEVDKSADAINEAKSIAMMRFLGVQCPVCNIFVEKVAGCNKMSCRNCYAIFCYRCGDRIEGYSHFNGSTSVCPLFSDTREQYGMQGRMRRRVRGVRVEMRAYRHTCPTCKQENIKLDNNNDIHCWACRCNYCFMCRTVIRGTIHFRTSKCTQHSA